MTPTRQKIHQTALAASRRGLLTVVILAAVVAPVLAQGRQPIAPAAPVAAKNGPGVLDYLITGGLIGLAVYAVARSSNRN